MPAMPSSPIAMISMLMSTSISVKPRLLSIGAVPIAVVVGGDVDTPAEVDVDAAHRHAPWRRRRGDVHIHGERPRGQAPVARVGEVLGARRAPRALDRQVAEDAVGREHGLRTANHRGDLPAIDPLAAGGEGADSDVDV